MDTPMNLAETSNTPTSVAVISNDTFLSLETQENRPISIHQQEEKRLENHS